MRPLDELSPILEDVGELGSGALIFQDDPQFWWVLFFHVPVPFPNPSEVSGFGCSPVCSHGDDILYRPLDQPWRGLLVSQPTAERVASVGDASQY